MITVLIKNTVVNKKIQLLKADLSYRSLNFLQNNNYF